jgi:acetyl-CoA carboxylase biotin carboxyl carrier protein
VEELSPPSAAGIRALADLCLRSGVESLEAAHQGWSVRLNLDLRAAPNPRGGSTPTESAPAAGPATQFSQWVGVFHRAAEQGAEPLAREGKQVREGDIVGVIIAMQLQSDVRAERDGVIGRFLVEDGGAVEYGQPLLDIG